jgi:hypothetical protein
MSSSAVLKHRGELLVFKSSNNLISTIAETCFSWRKLSWLASRYWHLRLKKSATVSAIRSVNSRFSRIETSVSVEHLAEMSAF